MTSSPVFRLAAAQYDIGLLKDWSAYEAKARRWVAEAVRNGARMLLFPEYFSMELVSLFSEDIRRDLNGQLEELQSIHADFQTLYAQLAQSLGLYILAGSFPVLVNGGQYRNRSWLFRPDGSRDYQDKLQMTRFESEQWCISPGNEIKVLDTEFGKIGVSICYDSEFPLIARQQVEGGANLILVPSCSDTQASYWRVRIGCQARAMENQCYVAQAPTVGEAPWSAAVDVNVGAAAIYTPVDYGFPDNGVLAIGKPEQAQWVYADIDLSGIERIRTGGQVFNYRDWPKQLHHSVA
jgi:predicted amidohydrolase